MRVFGWRRLKLHNRVMHGQRKYGRTFVAFSELAILLLANFELPLTLTLQRGVRRPTLPRLKDRRRGRAAGMVVWGVFPRYLKPSGGFGQR